MSLPRHLIIFTREPRLGQVKRRLAAEIGTVEAAAMHERLTRRSLRVLSRHPGWRTWLAVTPDGFAARARRVWPELPPGLTVIAQGGGDLGQRMDRALRRPPPGPAVLVGTDIPALAPGHIEAAFAALGRRDVVLGPAEDGGYWLVGVRRRPRFPYIFGGVRWSSPHAFADQVAALEKLGLSHTGAARLADIDDAAAYRAWRGTV